MSEIRDLFRNLGAISSMGISVVLAIAIGVWFGMFLDRQLATEPWFFWIFRVQKCLCYHPAGDQKTEYQWLMKNSSQRRSFGQVSYYSAVHH